MDALASSLELIRARLNAALQTAESRAEDWVILANVTGQDGRAFEDARDRIAMTLVHIAPDATRRAGRPPAAPPPAGLEPLVMFLANFENRSYAQGLVAISRTIAFFEQTPVFPAPHAGGETMTMLAAGLTLEEVGGVMRMMGVRYRPCVFYRLRGVAVG